MDEFKNITDGSMDDSIKEMNKEIKEDINEEFTEAAQTEELSEASAQTDEEVYEAVSEAEHSFNSAKEEYNSASSQQEDMQAYREELEKEIRYKRGAFRKTVAVGLVGSVLFGASLGGALGFAYNGSRSLFVKSAQPFSFDSQSKTEENLTPAEEMNITPQSDSILDTISKVQDSIVNISITEKQMGWFNQVYESEGAGSGIIYSEDDDKVYIVTNNHVVEDASEVSISISGKEQVKARLVGKDAASDVAVISVLKSDLKAAGIENVTVAQFGDSDSLQVGEYVIAIGNALGEGKTTTRGIISAQNKTVNIDGKKMTMIQTDAAINPGNSGGALVNSAGQVIGINTAKYSSYSVEGTGFAIPINSAQDIIKQLMENGTVDKPFLGISAYTIDEDFKFRYNIDTDGVFVTNVESGSAAENAGLQRTDIITAIDGVSVKSAEELTKEISNHKSGDSVTLSVIRNGYEPIEIKAVLKNLNEQF